VAYKECEEMIAIKIFQEFLDEDGAYRTDMEPEVINEAIAELQTLQAHIEELTDELKRSNKTLNEAYRIGKSQADEMDRFWAAFGLLSEQITIDDAIVFFKNKDARIAELEQPKTCETCEHSFYFEAADYFICSNEKNKSYCYKCETPHDMEITNDFGCTHYTTKAQQ
jgi:hypothetical protein